MRLFDHTHSIRFTLLIFTPPPSRTPTLQRMAKFAARMDELFGLDVNTVLIVPGAERSANLDPDHVVLLDPQLSAHSRYGAVGESLYLIRPDGYLGIRRWRHDPGAGRARRRGGLPWRAGIGRPRKARSATAESGAWAWSNAST